MALEASVRPFYSDIFGSSSHHSVWSKNIDRHSWASWEEESSRPAEAHMPISYPCSADKHGKEVRWLWESLPEIRDSSELQWHNQSAHGTYTEIHDTPMARNSKYPPCSWACDSIWLLTCCTTEMHQDSVSVSSLLSMKGLHDVRNFGNRREAPMSTQLKSSDETGGSLSFLWLLAERTEGNWLLSLKEKSTGVCTWLWAQLDSSFPWCH